ncbi:hypothetical protein, partial [uncultured Phascolarctobacterium sp.]|uniref:hypothetical protein n=1 Tax=uncultured Phascolarctobacterium sp. TaxID=512296 RepID=UPI0025E1D4EE
LGKGRKNFWKIFLFLIFWPVEGKFRLEVFIFGLFFLFSLTGNEFYFLDVHLAFLFQVFFFYYAAFLGKNVMRIFLLMKI